MAGDGGRRIDLPSRAKQDYDAALQHRNEEKRRIHARDQQMAALLKQRE